MLVVPEEIRTKSTATLSYWKFRENIRDDDIGRLDVSATTKQRRRPAAHTLVSASRRTMPTPGRDCSRRKWLPYRRSW
jgi:hypothetical protein